ncbi:MAG TPA: LLM class flavin-dependent oxidoreductase [Mycobacterium sp.]|nr:LLM class flavin-dependent oxidoreductase [Mycobacterium sp.]
MTAADKGTGNFADDIVTRLIETDIDGEVLDQTEFAFFVILLAVAGGETTRNATTHGMNALFDNADQWELFKRNAPKTAVDESIRWATPAHCFQRTALTDNVIGDVTIRRRQQLGLGVGWCAEEFELLGARFAKRGKRTEEMIELMRALWSPGWTGFDGEFYQTPRLEMSPAAPPIPIWVGGLSDVALRRAPRYDGWVGDGAISAAQQFHGHRAENSLPADGFAVLAPLVDAFTPADYERAERGGVTHVLTMPWMFYSGPDATLAEKVDGMKRFRRDQGLDG